MLNLITYGKDVQDDVRDRLAAEPWFAEHRVRVVEQDEQAIAALIEQQTSQIDGILAVISIDRMDNNAPAVQVQLSVIVTEYVPLNRAAAGYATARQVAEAVAQTIDGPAYRWSDITVEAIGDGAIQASLVARVMVAPPTK